MDDAGRVDDSFDLELAAASLRADSSDVRILVNALADELGDALGNRLTVQRVGGLLRRSGEIRSIRIELGEDQYAAELAGDQMTCTVAHSSGGIRIRSERVDVGEWLQRLLADLKSEAARSQAVRQALESIVIGGRP